MPLCRLGIYAVLFLHSLNATSATSFVQETELSVRPYHNSGYAVIYPHSLNASSATSFVRAI